MALELIGLVLTAVLLELWFARGLGPKRIGYSIIAAASATGVFWMAVVCGLSQLEWAWKTASV